MVAIDDAPRLTRTSCRNVVQVTSSACKSARLRIPVGSADGVAKSSPIT